MTGQELLASFDASATKPVYLLCPGKAPRANRASFEPFLADRLASHIVDSLVEKEARDFAYNSYHADETAPGEILSMANTLPFLSERRVILVRGVEHYENDDAMQQLVPYFENPCESAVLILIAYAIDQRRKLYKACEKGGFVVSCPQLTDNELRIWVNHEAKRLGLKTEPGAVNEIIQRAGKNLADVANAVQVVAGFIGRDTTITEEAVVQACADVAEEQVWDLTDAIAASNPGKALRVLRELIAMGKSEFEIMGTINWLLKTAYDLAAPSRGSGGRGGYTQGKVQPLADKFGATKLGEAFGLITETDFALRSTGTDRALMLELLVIKLATPRPSARRARA